MKGAIDQDHIPANKYELLFLGLPPLTAVEVSGIEDELVTTDLPDRTRATGGQRNATEFTIMLPEHHVLEQAAMEAWFIESQDPVLPTYKKVGTIIGQSISGNIAVSKSLVGVFPTKRVLPDREMANEGEMTSIEWTLSVDNILPI